MREAMARAEVGDDVWEEDPTVKRLEAIAAERLGKAAGLFVASGTMGNLVSVVSHTRAGQEGVLDLVVEDVRVEVEDDLLARARSEEHTSELQALAYIVCR